MARGSSFLTWTCLILALVNASSLAENERKAGAKATPKFIIKLFRELFGKEVSKEKRDAVEAQKGWLYKLVY